MRLALVVVCLLAFALAPDAQRPASRPFSVVEATIAGMQQAMREGRTTSRDIVQQSLTRIALYEDRLNAALHVNPRALAEADARDRERRQGRVRGPLHGIPVALKDNIHTTDMPTTGGALALAGLIPPYEATLTRHLREAGAIIIAKTTMTELANWVSPGMPTNYSSLGGFAFNPYDPRRDPREATADGRPVLATGGSSSGVGTAVSFWAANVGTETSGSILSPASQNMLAAIKPTVGRISRHGVIPITADQDTPGPMARTVADAAVMLGVLEGTPDPNDPATKTCTPPPGRDYTRFLRATGLAGARIGVPRATYFEALNDGQKAVLTDAIAALRARGATVVDPANLPAITWPVCSGPAGAKGRDEACSITFKYGMKRDFNAWLASLGAAAPVKTLTALREWNTAHERMGTLKYGQAQLDISDEMDVEADRARYLQDREKDVTISGRDGIDAVMKAHRLDALLFPSNFGALIAARAGYPTVIVPFGTVPNAVNAPAGFDPKPSPFGVSFTATACSEPRLIEIASAFEQATKRRVPPSEFP